jgi:hypothetical protein
MDPKYRKTSHLLINSCTNNSIYTNTETACSVRATNQNIFPAQARETHCRVLDAGASSETNRVPQHGGQHDNPSAYFVSVRRGCVADDSCLLRGIFLATLRAVSPFQLGRSPFSYLHVSSILHSLWMVSLARPVYSVLPLLRFN